MNPKKSWKFVALCPFFLAVSCGLATPLAGQHWRASSVPDLFNHEAMASDPAGILAYSKDLIELMLPDGFPTDKNQSQIDALANRLAQTEESARNGKGGLVSEQNVVRAFNALMQRVGAPSSLRTDEASMQRFRNYAASIHAFPALFTAARNGTNCNPGEAVFLLYLLVTENGQLTQEYVDSVTALEQQHQESHRNGVGARGYAMGGIFSSSRASELLDAYAAHHGWNKLFIAYKDAVVTLGF